MFFIISKSFNFSGDKSSEDYITTSLSLPDFFNVAKLLSSREALTKFWAEFEK